jgi:hypothetical protein
MNTSSPRYSVVSLDPAMAGQISALQEQGRRALLRVVLEVLEVSERGKALVWAHDQRGGGRSRLGSCRLSPAQLAEAVLLLDDGVQPVFEIAFEVLGALPDGRWGVASYDDQVVVTALPRADTAELDQLLAA